MDFLLPSLILALLNQDTISQTSVFPEDEVVTVCPGDVATYTCFKESSIIIISLTWSIRCHESPLCFTHGGQEEGPVTFSIEEGMTSLFELQNLNISMRLTFSRNIDNNQVESNMTLSIPDQTGLSGLRLGIDCEDSMNYRSLQVAGRPSPPHNLTRVLMATNTSGVEVSLHWSPPPQAHHVVDYTITITTDTLNNSSTTTMINTSHTNTIATLHFNTTSFITLYATICGHKFRSEEVTLNITITELCLPPVLPFGVEDTTVIEGYVISFQCEEGLVPEERVEAVCGADGRWHPDPALHCCSVITEMTSSMKGTTSGTTSGTISESGDASIILISVSISSSTAFLCVTMFMICILFGTCVKRIRVSQTIKNRNSQQPEETVSVDKQDGRESTPTYEEVLPRQEMIDFTKNASYGFIN